VNKITLAISITSLVVACTSLGWNIVQFRLSGGRVRVETSFAFGTGAFEQLPNMFGLAVRNIGRQPVQVTSIGIELGDGNKAIFGPAVIRETSDPLPLVLQPGHGGNWYVEAEGVLKLKTERGDVRRWRPFAQLGSGRRALGRLHPGMLED
jgi:hypothetical protein